MQKMREPLGGVSWIWVGIAAINRPGRGESTCTTHSPACPTGLGVFRIVPCFIEARMQPSWTRDELSTQTASSFEVRLALVIPVGDRDKRVGSCHHARRTYTALARSNHFRPMRRVCTLVFQAR